MLGCAANGSNALFDNTIGSFNTANGVNTLLNKSNNTNAAQFGLIAEEVAAVNPDLVVRDKDGEVYTVRYDPVIAMWLNEFLKEHPKVEQMHKQIEALTVGLHRVSAQLEARKPASQTVLNDR